MKLNWGYKIMAFYTIFVLGIVFLIYLSTQINTDLVTQDYYNQELAFQGMIEKQKHYDALTDKMQVKQNDSMLIVQFPKEMQDKKVDGTITLYCPSAERNDLHFNVNTYQALMEFSKMNIRPGYYTLKADWTAEHVPYYAEQNLMIQ